MLTQDQLERIEHYAHAFQAHSRDRNKSRELEERGYSGALGSSDLAPEVVDQMEAAIVEAFESVEEERHEEHDQSAS